MEVTSRAEVKITVSFDEDERKRIGQQFNDFVRQSSSSSTTVQDWINHMFRELTYVRSIEVVPGEDGMTIVFTMKPDLTEYDGTDLIGSLEKTLTAEIKSRLML